MDKALTSSSWKSFCSSNKRKYDDKSFLAALMQADKAADDPDGLNSALDLVDKHSESLRKDNKSDKDLEKYLKEVSGAVEKMRRQALADKKKAEKAQQKEDDDEQDDAADPAEKLLGGKTLTALKLAKTGQVMHATISVGGANTAVMVSNKDIAGSARSAVAKHLGGGGVRHFKGECVMVNNVLVFTLEQLMGGLAKRITKSLKEQFGKKYKVTVRGADGTEESDGEVDLAALADDDEDDGATAPSEAADGGDAGDDTPDLGAAAPDGDDTSPADTAPADGDTQAAAQDAAQDVGPDDSAPANEAGTGDDADAALRKQLVQRLRDASQALAQADPDTAGKVRGLLASATRALQSGDTDGASAALEQAEDLLNNGPQGDASGPDANGGNAASSASDAPDAPPAPPASGSAGVTEALRNALPEIQAAVKSNALPAAMMQQVVGKVNTLVGQKKFDDAQKLVTALLGNAKRSGAAMAKAHDSIDGATAAWDGMRSQIDQALVKLKAAAMQAVKEHNADPAATTTFDEGQVASGLETVHGVMEKLDTRLNERLHACRNKPGEERSNLAKEVEAVISEYENYVQSDPLLQAIDRSGFADTPLQQTVMGVLETVRGHLESVRA